MQPAPEPELEQPFWAQFRDWVRMQSLLRMGRTAGVTLLFILVFATAQLTRSVDRRPLPAPIQQATGAGALTDVPQQVLATSPEIERAVLLDFLSDIAEIRTRLNAAQAVYRNQANSSSTTVAQVAAVKQYHSELAAAAEELRALTPPEPLREAYQQLLAGIDIEQAALDDLLSFYSEYNVALANRAALRLQDASTSYQQAQAVWDAYTTQIAEQSPSSSFELR